MNHPAAAVNRSHRPRESAPEWVRNEILTWIERGDYKPADPLPSEREMQVMFGVSRVVVREAIVRLQAVGLVKVEHGRGCRVSATLPDLMHGPFRAWLDLNGGEVINLLKLRRALDGLAAEEAATAADEEALRAIADCERTFAEAAGAGADPIRLASLDKSLHVAIATASGVSVVVQLLGELDDHAANIHRTIMAMGRRPAESVRDHRSIVTAIRSGNPGRARRAAEGHVEGSIVHVRSVLVDQDGAQTIAD